MTLTPKPKTTGEPALLATFENASKLLSFGAPNTNLGAMTYGQAAIGTRTASSFLPEFEAAVAGIGSRSTVGDFAKRLSDFFIDQWKAGMPTKYVGPDMIFVFGGYDDGQPYGNR